MENEKHFLEARIEALQAELDKKNKIIEDVNTILKELDGWNTLSVRNPINIMRRLTEGKDS